MSGQRKLDEECTQRCGLISISLTKLEEVWISSRIIIGIDPGLTRCGFAVLDGLQILNSGVITTEAGMEQEYRLLTHYNELKDLFNTYGGQLTQNNANQVDVVIERPFLTKRNPDTGLGTAQVAGISMLLAAQHNFHVYLYTPAQVKSIVAGTGNATKQQIYISVSKLVQGQDIGVVSGLNPDLNDAIAVALTHHLSGHAKQLQELVPTNIQNTPTFELTLAQQLWAKGESSSSRRRKRKL